MVIFAKRASYFGKIHKNPRLNRKNGTSSIILHNETNFLKTASNCKAKTEYPQQSVKHKHPIRRHTQPSPHCTLLKNNKKNLKKMFNR